MSAITQPGRRTALPPALAMRRFNVDEYHRMIAAGVLKEGEPIELLDGWLVLKMTRNPPHDLSLSLTKKQVEKRLPDDWFLRIQSAITIPQYNEPEPDIGVVRGPERRYATRHPGPADIAMLVEISDASLQEDREDKAPVYAAAAIPVYWVVNIPEAKVEVYADPTGPDPHPSYRHHQDYAIGDEVPLVIDGREVAKIPVKDLLP
jgi:Putative restriction endonuclease